LDKNIRSKFEHDEIGEINDNYKKANSRKKQNKPRQEPGKKEKRK